ncbi:MAG: hypothetical protein LBQ34_00450 [Alphaproteobacteria bacterium]|jgi:predicted transcriptional regulator|nr:hypothetical protein [Alphaproteobacteria bacterium]
MKNAALKKIPKKTTNLKIIEEETYLKELGPLQDWQIARIRRGIKDIEEGRGISEEEMDALFDKYMNE